MRLTRTFWAETAERALFAAAWTFLSLLTVSGTADALDAESVALSANWPAVFLAAGIALVLSVAKSIVIGLSPLGAAGSPSAVETSGRHAQ